MKFDLTEDQYDRIKMLLQKKIKREIEKQKKKGNTLEWAKKNIAGWIDLKDYLMEQRKKYGDDSWEI